MSELLDALDLPGRKRLAIVNDGGRWSALPQVHNIRASAGDGASEALLELLTQGSQVLGRFTVHSWAARIAAGERAVGVDQTNESVIVGDSAVVKWSTHLETGPDPAPSRIGVLRDAGFTGMPTPWGLVTWRSPAGDEILVASVDEYLKGAVDGWTWAPELITAATQSGNHTQLIEAATSVGTLVASMHTALAATTSTATAQDCSRWREDALHTLDVACTAGESASIGFAREHRHTIAALFDELGGLAGTSVIDGHGDLHVGQVLRSADRFVVTDFDGNPVLSPQQRILAIPTVLDVAGMVQSLTHSGIVARKYTELDTDALADTDAAARRAFLAAYLTNPDARALYDPAPLRAFRVQQILREIIYAAQYLPRWMYVPDAALPALLEERTAP
ncbi:MAG: glucosamine kinase [Mycobacterium sp.]